ncbi:helix-turn-helix domain-containing protein [Flavobacterium rakeshii]|uniref:helix-turn-helix domain-containing protein n=1 Tax=Flavobacterium rakeshii TaxID=1038845 RepID=UPI002E7BEA91|nr:helix-turn-helix domain-containing protein [Flavobacterium rakeshii]MEE1899811.1 helix-turn-helix domain-containing protein [Flavobacterium rakeshii]
MAQIVTDTEKIFAENINGYYNNPVQTIKAAEYLLKNANSSNDKVKAYYMLSESKFLTDDFSESVEYLFKANLLADSGDNHFLKSLVYIAISSRCRFFGIEDRASSYIARAEQELTYIEGTDAKTVVEAKILYEKAGVLIKSKQYSEAINALSSSNKLLENSKQNHPVLQAKVRKALANVSFLASDYVAAANHYQKCIDILKGIGFEFSSIAACAYNGMGQIAIKNSQYDVAQAAFEAALACNVIESWVKADVYQNLSELYLKTDDQELYNDSSIKHKEISTALIWKERDARNILITEIEKEQNIVINKDRSRYTSIFVGMLLVFAIVFIVYFVYNKKLDDEYNKFEKLLSRIEAAKINTVSVSDVNEVTDKAEGKILAISEKTEQAVLEKLKEFERGDEFTNPNMSLQLLSKRVKTNSKYLSDIINTNKGKNFNAYINDLRINYIVALMQSDKKYLTYKVSYLAEICGFSSHSAFTVVFKSVTDLTPKQFINFLKKKIEKEKESA